MVLQFKSWKWGTQRHHGDLRNVLSFPQKGKQDKNGEIEYTAIDCTVNWRTKRSSLCNDWTTLYGPQRRKIEKSTQEFYKNLHSITNKINKDHYIILAGDINTTLVNKLAQDYTTYICHIRLIICLKIDHTQEYWGIVVVLPIYKKANKDDWNNYRAISLLNNFYKIYAKILENWIQNLAENTLLDT
jgi:hypothetical protein